MVLLLLGCMYAAVHSLRAGRRFGSPAGHSGDTRIKRWTGAVQPCDSH